MKPDLVATSMAQRNLLRETLSDALDRATVTDTLVEELEPGVMAARGGRESAWLAEQRRVGQEGYSAGPVPRLQTGDQTEDEL